MNDSVVHAARATADSRVPVHDFLNRLLLGQAEPPPIAKLIGFRPVEGERGRAVFELDVDPSRHANPMGTLHGGCRATWPTGPWAYASSLAEGETFTTLELKINFLKPVWNARLRAEARVVKRGKTVGMVECDVADETGSLVARASSTCMTLSGKEAAGR